MHGGISEEHICFEGNIEGNTAYDWKQMMFIRAGTITPLYSFNRTAFNDSVVTPENNFTGADDLHKLYLDLHIFND